MTLKVLVCLCIAFMAHAQLYENCKINHKGSEIDLNKLRSPEGYYIVKDSKQPTWSYFIQICDVANNFQQYTSCKKNGVESKSYEYGHHTSICEPMASPAENDVTIELLDENDASFGAQLTYLPFEYSGYSKTVKIQMMCDPNEKQLNQTSLKYVGEQDTGSEILYVFRIRSHLACPANQTSAALIVGISFAVMTASVVFLLCTYFFVGTLYRKYHLQESGWAIVPHHQLWSSLLTFVTCGRFRKTTTHTVKHAHADLKPAMLSISRRIDSDGRKLLSPGDVNSPQSPC
ncbi:hypothetical protein AKO1_006209 [Acrasis kona]|uniref:Autophagy-related protein 27 n=1 Tax=Acrasis kona TaxID=1008807 RepID=A0AAW2YIA5_9EUKA